MRPKLLKDGRNISIYLEKSQLEKVKRIARHMSVQEARDISFSEAIRMALDICYPGDRQMELFVKNPQRKLRRNDQQMTFM